MNSVKKSVYEGMAIYSLIKNLNIPIYKGMISENDKKYLSLYLGLINSNNNKLISVSFELDDYLSIYEEDFIQIFNEINFESMDAYKSYLLSKSIVCKFNSINNDIIKNKNKTLIKK